MFDISKAVRARVTNASKENILAAEQACFEAKMLLKQATGTKDQFLISEAVELYLEAIELYSRMAEPYIALAYIAVLMGKNEDALKLLHKVLDFDPLNPNAKSMLSEIQQQKVSEAITKESEKFLNHRTVRPKMKAKKDFISRISEIFNLKPKKEKQKKTVKNEVLTPAVNPGSNRPAVIKTGFAPGQKNSSDFAAMLSETKKFMNLRQK